jgi:hypothetical protein
MVGCLCGAPRGFFCAAVAVGRGGGGHGMSKSYAVSVQTHNSPVFHVCVCVCETLLLYSFVEVSDFRENLSLLNDAGNLAAIELATI